MYAPLHLNFVSFWPSHHFRYLRVCLILLHALVGVYLLWREGCVGFWAHILNLSPLLGLGIAWAESPHLPVEPMFSFSMFVSLLAIDPAILLHRAYYNFTSSFLVPSWAYELLLLLCQLTSSSIFT